jgi:DNA-binding FadR family transcriptional regulator
MKNQTQSKPISRIGLSPKSGSTQVALRQLRSLIERGRFLVDNRLPPERELADQLQVGRSTLRKALEILEAEGHIWRHVGQGTFVGQPAAPVRREALFAIGKVSPRELLDARMTLEPSIAASAAISARPSDIARMKQAADKRESTKQPQAYNLWDHQFHLAIAEATQNAVMVALLEQLNSLRRVPAWSTFTRDRMRDPYYSASKRDHRKIIAAIEKHDPAAAFRAMKDHIMNVQGGFFSWLEDVNAAAVP